MLELNDLKKQLDVMKERAINKINSVADLQQLQLVKVEYTGKNAVINSILKKVKQSLSQEKQIPFFSEITQFRNAINEVLKMKSNEIEKKIINEKLKSYRIDLTLPGIEFIYGYQNPLCKTVDEICYIFKNLGYQIISGTEVDNEEYNFNRLNLPANHPARTMQDTFYIDNDEKQTSRFLLRTHATNMTARLLSQRDKNVEDALAIISLGNVYRKDDDDATHSHQFMQVDGFLVAKNISFANLKWTLNYFCQQIFGEQTKTRLRPSYFPFTEPSVEVDVNCPICAFKGCFLCKQTGWIEVLGAGMIHPHVFKAASLPETTVGFAFGVGIERIAMIKYGIDDIRLFYNNDLRFLKQF